MREEWDWPSAKGLQAVREEVLGYFRNQVDRMDYPTDEANGWFIGSGAVESACKTVVGQRLKGSGMRWGERVRTRCATCGRCTAARRPMGRLLEAMRSRLMRMSTN